MRSFKSVETSLIGWHRISFSSVDTDLWIFSWSHKMKYTHSFHEFSLISIPRSFIKVSSTLSAIYEVESDFHPPRWAVFPSFKFLITINCVAKRVVKKEYPKVDWKRNYYFSNESISLSYSRNSYFWKMKWENNTNFYLNSMKTKTNYETLCLYKENIYMWNDISVEFFLFETL